MENIDKERLEEALKKLDDKWIEDKKKEEDYYRSIDEVADEAFDNAIF